VDEVLRLAHEQQATLAGVDAELLRSKEFLAKVSFSHLFLINLVLNISMPLGRLVCIEGQG